LIVDAEIQRKSRISVNIDCFEDNPMKINQSKLWAIAFLTAPLIFMQNLVLAQNVAPRSELYSQRIDDIPFDYEGDFCIVLGPITQYADVILDWGAFTGKQKIYPDRSLPSTHIYGVNVNAGGDNITDAMLYTSPGVKYKDSGETVYPQVIFERCQRTDYRIQNPVYLNWTDRGN
jgi:hypothetical protein